MFVPNLAISGLWMDYGESCTQPFTPHPATTTRNPHPCYQPGRQPAGKAMSAIWQGARVVLQVVWLVRRRGAGRAAGRCRAGSVQGART